MGKLEQILGEIDNIDTGTIEMSVVLIRLTVLEAYRDALLHAETVGELSDNFRKLVTEL